MTWSWSSISMMSRSRSTASAERGFRRKLLRRECLLDLRRFGAGPAQLVLGSNGVAVEQQEEGGHRPAVLVIAALHRERQLCEIRIRQPRPRHGHLATAGDRHGHGAIGLQ